jgi:hypothetical protein
VTRTEAVLVLVLVVAAVYGLMYAGWRRRSRRHHSASVATTTTPATAPGADAPAVGDVRAEGTYVSTTTVASRLERVVAGGLGVRARATMVVGTGGVRWTREGAAEVHVEPDRLTGVGRERGMAGKWVGQNRLVVVTWRGDDGEEFATGFLPRHAAQIDELVAAVERRLPIGLSGGVPGRLSGGSDAATSQSSTSPSSTQPNPDGDQ